MASLTRWTWVWVNSGSWWWTGRPAVLQFMGLQRVGHDWETELNWTELMVFPVVRYSCESWTIKKAECQRTDAFELWCWKRLLRVPWTARRSNHSILKEISPEYSLEGLMLELKLQYFCHLVWRADFIPGGKDADIEKYWRQKKGMAEDEMFGRHHWFNGHEFEQTLGDNEGQGSLACCSP